jgi:hypothetical protein
VILDMAFTSHLIQGEAQSNHVSVRSESSRSHRSRPLRALFVHRDTDAIDVCVQELEKAQFTVSSDRALNPRRPWELLRVAGGPHRSRRATEVPDRRSPNRKANPITVDTHSHITLEKCEMQAQYAVGEKCELVYK